ncbi:MAG: hypothetical protein KC425_10565 [Anaerolineales bacterium]|nr:hypothetical protein [Anaerolineales bacterium]
MAAFDFLGLKKSIADIGSQAASLRDQLEAAKQEREEAAAAPVPRSELADALCQWVDKIGEQYPAHLVNAARDLRDNAERDPMNRAMPPALLTVNPGGSDQAIRPAVLCYLLNDAIKDGMRRAADEMPYPAPEGLPRAERLKKLEALDKKIAKLEGELLDLLREADAAGVSLTSEPKLTGKLKV